jgi:Methyltransferase domain.
MEIDNNKLKSLLINKKILEFGCNKGLITKQLLAYNPKKIYCLDFNDKFEKKIKTISEKVEFKKINFLIKEDLLKIPKDIDVVFLRDIFNCFDYQTNLKIISDIYDVFGRDVKIILICFYDRIVLKTFILSLLRLKFVNGYRNFLKLRNNNSFIKNHSEKFKYFPKNKIINIVSKDLFEDHLNFLQKLSNNYFKYTMVVE